MNTVEQRQRRAQLVQDARVISETATRENRAMSAGESSRFDQLLAQSDTMLAEIERQERLEVIERGLNFTQPPPNPDIPAPGGDPTQRGQVAEAWVDRDGNAVRVLGQAESYRSFVRSRGVPESEISLGRFLRAIIVGPQTSAERRSLQETVDGSGGFTVPVDLLAQLIDLLRARSVIWRAGARTVPLNTLKTSIARLASDPTAAWRAELGPVGEAGPTFESVPFTAKSLGCIVRASRELLADSSNASSAIEGSLAAAFAGEIDRVALIGSGSGAQPKGISLTSGVGSVDMGAVAGAEFADYSPFIDAWLALANANAAEPTAAIMPPRTAAKLGKLQDTTDQPLQKPALIANLPFLVTSKLPINETHGSSNAASRVIVGNFAELMIGIREQFSIGIARELYAATGEIGFVCHARMDVALAHPASFCQIIGVL